MRTKLIRFNRRWLAACLVAQAVMGGIASAATSYDLRTDWSDTSNPNGVWALRAGTTTLPSVSDWALGGFSSPQPGWGFGSTSLPFWFRSAATPLAGEDWLLGDIVVHTQDDYHGAGNGAANVIWTSPSAGTIDITGSVWEGRDIGSIGGGLRGNRWNLYVRDNLISTGTVAGGDPYSRANPFTFNLGSGGAGVLSDISVGLGDVVRLEIVRTSSDGDFVGVNFGIAMVPEPCAASLLALGGILLVTFQRRTRNRTHPER